MVAAEIEFPQIHELQEEVRSDPSRFKVLACGRRWGKTRLAALMCLDEALQGGMVWWVAPIYKEARIGWRICKFICNQIPNVKIRESDWEIVFEDTGGIISFKTADDPDNLRGEGLDFLVVDEAAFCSEEIWTVLRPSLVDRQGRVLFISTPNGMNWFERFWRRGQEPLRSKRFPHWKSWQYASHTNPFIPATELEETRQEMTETDFQQEHLAHFLKDEGHVFRHLDRAARARPQPRAIPGHAYVIGVDWGQSNDFTVFSVIDATLREQCYLEASNKVDYKIQGARLNNLNSIFQPDIIHVEINSMGIAIFQWLNDLYTMPLQAFTTTNASKHRLVTALSLTFDNDTLAVLPDDDQLSQLRNFTPKKLPSGVLSYGAPDGEHDDKVIALALANAVLESTTADIAAAYHMVVCPACGTTNLFPPWIYKPGSSGQCKSCGIILHTTTPTPNGISGAPDGSLDSASGGRTPPSPPVNPDPTGSEEEHNPWMDVYSPARTRMHNDFLSFARRYAAPFAGQFGNVNTNKES